MRANTPRAWRNLSPGDKRQIEQQALRIAQEQNAKDMRIILDLYIKMVCLTLHDAFGFGEKRLTAFLGNHKRLFHNQRKMVKNDTQIDYLNGRMAEIFKKSGFPQSFFDELLGPLEEANEQEGGQ